MTDTSGDRLGERPALPSIVSRLVREEAARAGIDPKAFWQARGDAVRQARHKLWSRISIEAGWSASRIGRAFGVSHRAVLYGIDQAKKRAVGQRAGRLRRPVCVPVDALHRGRGECD